MLYTVHVAQRCRGKLRKENKKKNKTRLLRHGGTNDHGVRRGDDT